MSHVRDSLLTHCALQRHRYIVRERDETKRETVPCLGSVYCVWQMPSNSADGASDPRMVVCPLTGRGVFPEFENKITVAMAQTSRQRGVARDCPRGAIACSRYNCSRCT
ncbi:hypothetical protein MRX96_044229 [Rhipicephalus microplus]